MTNRNYRNGAAKEYRVRKKLLAEGWEVVVRSAGSHSMFDLVAVKAPSMDADGQILFVQCKTGEGAEREREKALSGMKRFEGYYTASARAD